MATLFHLLRHHLRHHPVIYPLAAVLIFASQFLPAHLSGRTEQSTWLILVLLGIASVVARLVMRDHPWHSDTVFWRTRPVSPRTLFTSQLLAIGLVVLLPLAAGLLLRVVPLSLGPLPATLAILVPLAAAAVLATILATCAALATGNRGRDTLPYFAAFLAPLLSTATYGLFKMHVTGHHGPSPGDAGMLSQFLCALALAAVASLVALGLATLGRRWRPAVVTLLITALALPWVIAEVRVNFFRPTPPPSREIGVVIPPAKPGGGRRPRPSWTGLEEGEFFIPRLILADWTQDGRNHPWRWPDGSSPGRHFTPRLNSDLLRNTSHHSVLEDQYQHFAASTDIPAIWKSIRHRLPKHTTWRPAEALPHIYVPVDLGSGPEKPRFSLHAVGDIYRLESLTPLSPVARGRIDSPRPGCLEIQQIAHDDTQIAILLRQAIPNPSLFSSFQHTDNYSTSPPEFWAVLFHAPSATAYACHGPRVRLRYGLETTIIPTRHHLLSFQLPRLETRLLGLDPRQLLAESTLHLFQAVPIACGEANK